MTIDSRRLTVLLAVARNGGVVAAADELHISPSGVSQQLTKLEREVGQTLVHRTTRGSVLTTAGLAMAEAAEEVERVLSTALATVRDESVVEGTVRVGAFTSFMRAVMVPRLAEWRAQFPQLRVELVEDDFPRLAKLLGRRELDALIVELDSSGESTPLPRGMIEDPLLDEPWRLIVPSRSMSGPGNFDLARLSLPWLGAEVAAASSVATNRLRRAAGITSREVHHYSDTLTALALVAAGEGVALVPALALSESLPDGVDVVDQQGFGTRKIVLRRFARRTVSAPEDTVVRLIKDAVNLLDLASPGALSS